MYGKKKNIDLWTKLAAYFGRRKRMNEHAGPSPAPGINKPVADPPYEGDDVKRAMDKRKTDCAWVFTALVLGLA